MPGRTMQWSIRQPVETNSSAGLGLSPAGRILRLGSPPRLSSAITVDSSVLPAVKHLPRSLGFDGGQPGPKCLRSCWLPSSRMNGWSAVGRGRVERLTSGNGGDTGQERRAVDPRLSPYAHRPLWGSGIERFVLFEPGGCRASGEACCWAS